MFPFPTRNVWRNLAQQANDRAGDSGYDQQQHHHGNGTVLILVVERRSKEPVASDGFNKTSRLLKIRCRPPWDAFSGSDIAAHVRYHTLAGHSPYEVNSTPQPSFTDATQCQP